MRFISGEEIDRILDFPRLIEALAEAFAGAGHSPGRHHHEFGRDGRIATHLVMPAWTGDAPGAGQFLGTKLVNVFPGNATLGLPAVLGVYVLQSGQTGAPIAVIDGTRLTHWRTAAASGLAARFLARPDARRLTLVGAGALAPFLARAHAAVRPIDHVSVWNHRLPRAEQLCDMLRQTGLAADVATDLETAVAGADIVSCATLSNEPLVLGKWLQPGTHLDLVGAFSMTMREADAETLRRCRIFIDTPAATQEGGDVALGLREGSLAPADIVADLQALCRGTAAGRASPAELTLFKSIGAALEDLAAAMLVWRLHGGSPG